MDNQHQYWMRKAIDNAKIAQSLMEVPVGAVIVKDNQIIANGFNQSINQQDPTAHAEIVAIRQAAKATQNYRLPNTSLYVTLEPCAMCVGAIIHARISRVVFGAYDQKTGVVCSKSQLFIADFSNHQPKIIAGVLAQECGSLLTEFFQSRRNNSLR